VRTLEHTKEHKHKQITSDNNSICLPYTRCDKKLASKLLSGTGSYQQK